jgi:hypothetical protein
MVPPVCNTSSKEAEEGGKQIWCQPEIHSKTLLQEKKRDTEEKSDLENSKVDNLSCLLSPTFFKCYFHRIFHYCKRIFQVGCLGALRVKDM